MKFLGSVWTSRDNERLSIWHGGFSTISMSIVTGFVAMYLLDGLHASHGEMGLLNSLPSFVNLFAMLPAAIWIRRVQSKRLFCVTATTISRSFYVWMALVPLLPVHDPAIWVVWMVALTRVPQSFGDLSWQALIGDLIDPTHRSDFFSERNRVLTIVGLVVTFLTGLLLQQFNAALIWPYQLVFLSTVVFAVFEILLLVRHDESQAFVDYTVPVIRSDSQEASRPTGEEPGRHGWKRVMHDRRFAIAAAALLLFNFGWQMSWPLFSIFQISTAHASALWLGLFQVAGSTTQVLTFRWWGRMAERYGNGRVLAFAAFGMAVSPIGTVLSTNMWYLLTVSFVTGIPLAGTILLLFNYLLEVCPSDERTAYIATYNVLLSVIGFIAPEIGIWLLDNVGMTWGMGISSILRMVGGVAFFIVSFLPLMASQVGSRSELGV